MADLNLKSQTTLNSGISPRFTGKPLLQRPEPRILVNSNHPKASVAPTVSVFTRQTVNTKGATSAELSSRFHEVLAEELALDTLARETRLLAERSAIEAEQKRVREIAEAEALELKLTMEREHRAAESYERKMAELRRQREEELMARLKEDEMRLLAEQELRRKDEEMMLANMSEKERAKYLQEKMEDEAER
ncbi:unnamed protein product [Protopolystoma xenopodis]|uniref:Uncharacterized protein n=1 Tax=Protopolystoma xenopodis TaxID=117903 RepID=A0A3S5CEP9_9PLAT|nr:unnamed protein product [Protopolystoma xenopodis]